MRDIKRIDGFKLQNKVLPISEETVDIVMHQTALFCADRLISQDEIRNIAKQIVQTEIDRLKAEEKHKEDERKAEEKRKDAERKAEEKRKDAERIADEKRKEAERIDVVGQHLLAEINSPAVQFQILNIDEANGRALVISKDCVREAVYTEFADSIERVTWETCTLRKWLNTEFYNSLSEPIKQRVIESELSYPDTGHGDNKTITKDMVFLLSVNEAQQYFPNDSSRIAMYNGKATRWWLRSPDDHGYIAACIYRNGNLFDRFDRNGSPGVRPALWVSLNVKENSTIEERNKPDVKNKQMKEDKLKTAMASLSNLTGIEWLLLEYNEQNNWALVITKDCVAIMSYSKLFSSATWETSNLRKWLNSNYYNALPSKVKTSIVDVPLSKECNSSKYGSKIIDGNATRDKIFLLNKDEVDKYLGGQYNESTKKIANFQEKSIEWWLRSPGVNTKNVATVKASGYIDTFGNSVNNKLGVRPALWLNLDSFIL